MNLNTLIGRRVIQGGIIRGYFKDGSTVIFVVEYNNTLVTYNLEGLHLES